MENTNNDLTSIKNKKKQIEFPFVEALEVNDKEMKEISNECRERLLKILYGIRVGQVMLNEHVIKEIINICKWII